MGRKIARSAEEYDATIRWRARLRNERPFFEKIFKEHNVNSVLDCACGTGRHALLFKELGLEVEGFDLDEDMVRAARRNTREAKRKIRFFRADLTSFARSCKRTYAACISIGNSLSLAGPRSTLKAFLKNAAKVLETGGILMTQIINYRTIKEGEYTFVPPRIAGKGQEVFCLVKFFERRKERIFVNFVKAARRKDGIEQDHFRSELTPYYRADFAALLKRDFSVIGYFGDYRFAKFGARKSKDLIVVARRT
jgi:SAM-dependent methyltransferase